MHPCYFGIEQVPLFGHLHLPADGVVRGPAVVLCPPFGHEHMASHRTYLTLARRLAEQGAACLRFDYPGCGDSADPVDAPALGAGVAHWPAAIGQAIDHLRAVVGCSKVSLVGLRLGATLALHAAAGRHDVAAVIAMVPVLRGRAFVRECKALAMATRARAGLTEGDPRLIEAGGYVLNEADAAYLSTLDLLRLPAPPVAALQLIEREDHSADDAWVDGLRAQGLAVERVPLPGYEALMQAPHFAIVPEAFVAQAERWLLHEPNLDPTPHPVDLSRLRTRAVLPQQGVQDEAFWFDGPTPLSAVVSTSLAAAPAAPAAEPRTAVLFINTGAEHRIGTNRMYTPWARHWAAQGRVVMRVDLAGLGNSPKVAGTVDNDIHLHHAVDNVNAAVALLRSRYGVAEVHLIGLCSGAFHVMSCAFAGSPLRSVTAINQMVYFWQPNMPLVGEASAAIVVAITEGVGRSLTDPQRWLKLLRGEVNVRVILMALWRRLGQRAAWAWRSLRRGLGWPLPNDLAAALRHTVATGLDVHLVFARNEPGLTLLREHAGGVVSQLAERDNFQFTVLENADHTFTQSEARARLFGVIDQRLRRLGAFG